MAENTEANTYSTQARTESEIEADRRRRRPARKRRAKPEAFAARLKSESDVGEAAPWGAGEGGA